MDVGDSPLGENGCGLVLGVLDCRDLCIDEAVNCTIPCWLDLNLLH